MKLLLIVLVSISSISISMMAQAVTNQSRLIYGEATRLQQLDPYTVHEISGQRLSDLLFDNLIEVGPGGEYRGALARSWTIESGGTAIRIQLRDDVTWHPQQGQPAKPFIADDVITTIRLLQNPNSAIPNQDRFLIFKSAEKIGAHDLRITFQRALSDPLRPLMFKVLPDYLLGGEKALSRDHSFTKQPIGTGPYRLVQSNAQGELKLAANPDYYQGVPGIGLIVMKPFADQSVMTQSLMFRSLDLVTYVSPQDVRRVAGDRNLQIVPYDALSYSFLAINNDRDLLKDRRIRQAISYSLNREEVLNAFFQGEGHLVSGPFPPTSWAYNLDVDNFSYNPQRARDLLQAAGLKSREGAEYFFDKNGQEFALDFVVPISGESEMIKRIALAFQAYLQQAGLRSNLRFLEWQVWKEEVLGKHNYDLTIASWDFDDSANISSLFHSAGAESWGNNFVNYRNPQVDSMLAEAEATNDFDKRRAIYQRLHAIIAEDTPYSFLWTLQHHAAHNERLQGVQIEPFSFFKHIAAWSIKGK